MKDVVHYNLFPVGISHRESFLSEEECQEILKLAPESICVEHDTISGESISSHRSFNSIIDEIDSHSGINLKERILSEVTSYNKHIGTQECLITNSWVNYQYKGSVLRTHTHPGSVVSGALYLKVDESSSKLNFFNPNPFNHFTALDVDNYTPYSFQHVWFQPKVGDLYLFPSWLSHGSNGEQNNSDQRVVMSFNTTTKFI